MLPIDCGHHSHDRGQGPILALPEMVPEGNEAPKKADVIHWCGYMAKHVARGSSAKEVSGYLKNTSKAAWDLFSWLTHASGARRADDISHTK